MQLFRRLFNFPQGEVKQIEQRLNHRFTPGPAFPLQAWLLTGGKESPAKIDNLSGNGLGLVVLDPAVPAEIGQEVRVKLVLASYQQTLRGRLAQVRPEGNNRFFGVDLSRAGFLEKKNYLQLLQPVAIGQSLAAVPPERVVQNEPQFIKQVYRGEEQSVLTVWLEKSFGTPLHSFEFEMHDYFCRADAKSGQFEAYVRESTDSHKAKLSNPVFDISGDLQTEIRQLFRWIVPNLARNVPDDVRAFLQRFAN
jgi:hypothetical protein